MMKANLLLPKLFSVIFLLFLLSACGFHLRGYEPMPKKLQTLHLETKNPYSVFTKQLEQSLKNASVHLVVNPQDAITLQILDDNFSRQVNSIGSGGQNTVYVLSYTITYQLLDRSGVLIRGPLTVNTTRNYSVSSVQTLGDIYVEHDLEADMRRDVIYQLLNQLQSRKFLP